MNVFDECQGRGKLWEKTRWLAWNDLFHFQVFQIANKNLFHSLNITKDEFVASWRSFTKAFVASVEYKFLAPLGSLSSQCTYMWSCRVKKNLANIILFFAFEKKWKKIFRSDSLVGCFMSDCCKVRLRSNWSFFNTVKHVWSNMLFENKQFFYDIRNLSFHLKKILFAESHWMLLSQAWLIIK